MTKYINRSSCAFHAIAVSLALCSTPLFAQEVGTAAPAAAAADPAPVVVLPAQPAAQPAPATVQPIATSPVEAPAVAASNDAPAGVRTAPKARSTAVARPAPAPRVTQQVAASALPASALPASALPVVAATKPLSAVTPAPSPIASPQDQAQPAPVPQPTAAQPSDAQRSDNGSLLGLGALAALGIVGLGAFAARRRRRIVTDYQAPTIVDPIDSGAMVPIVTEPDYATYAIAETAHPVRTMPSPSITMPDGPVPTGEARQRLIARMVAGEPDAANPFTTAKGRRRRARLILQARENEQQHENQDGFDWRNFQTTRERAAPVADRTTVDA